MKGDVKGSLVPSRLSLLVFGVEDYNGLFNEGDDGKEEGRREKGETIYKAINSLKIRVMERPILKISVFIDIRLYFVRNIGHGICLPVVSPPLAFPPSPRA